MTNKNYLCRVCGYCLDYMPWGEDNESPDYSYCPSCGIEFGYQDYKIDSIKKTRKEWIKMGMKWSDESVETPVDWDPKEQIKNISEEYI